MRQPVSDPFRLGARRLGLLGDPGTYIRHEKARQARERVQQAQAAELEAEQRAAIAAWRPPLVRVLWFGTQLCPRVMCFMGLRLNRHIHRWNGGPTITETGTIKNRTRVFRGLSECCQTQYIEPPKWLFQQPRHGPDVE